MQDNSRALPTLINVDLDGLSSRPFVSAHRAIRAMSSLISLTGEVVSDILKDFNSKRFISAYIYIQDTVESYGRSATKTLKRIGPSMDPCGTERIKTENEKDGRGTRIKTF